MTTASPILPTVSGSYGGSSGLYGIAFTITAVPSGNNVGLSWAAQPGAVGYTIVRDGATITFGVTGTSYTDTPGPGSYTYEVGVLQ